MANVEKQSNGRPRISARNCQKCGQYLPSTAFYAARSKFHPDGVLPICKQCLAEMVDRLEWATMDKFCQWADYPFIPDLWGRLRAELGVKALDSYIRSCNVNKDYGALDWKQMQSEWEELLENGGYRSKVTAFSEAELVRLRKEWGTGYSDDELNYLEHFYQDLCRAHNILDVTQQDSARNLAKLSVRISRKIAADDEVDKDIRSYNELKKSSGFIAENVKNMADFDSVGEVYSYLEKTGWANPYFEGVDKDVVDKTISNNNAFLRRLVMGEVNLKEQIEQRLSSIGMSEPGELLLSDEELEKYEDDGYQEIEVKLDGDSDETSEFEL